MKKIFKGLLFGSCTFSLNEFTPATENSIGTHDDALALVKVAVTFHHVNGLQATLREANHADNQFSLKDLQVIAVDTDGTILAHGEPSRVGKNLLKCQDAKEIFINPEFIRLANRNASKGFVHYRSLNRFTKVPQLMCAYLEKHEDVYWVCGYRL
jgi:hypothetical protein